MNKTGYHICIVCSRLDLQGGIERACVNLADLFYQYKHKVTILILDSTAELFYPVKEGIIIVQENLHFGITEKGNTLIRKAQFLKHIVRLRSIYKNMAADFIISTEYSLTIPSFIASNRLAAKLIGWEHHHFFWMQKNTFWDLLFRYAYPKLCIIVSQNSTEKKLFETMGCKAEVIPYVVPQQNKTALLKAKCILSVGWLIKRKGVDLIPAVAEKVFNQHPDWTWKIIGEGEEFLSLKSRLQSRGLEKKVIIQKPGSPHLDKEYLEASVFVLLSRFECLPLVLLEATTFGVPCVAFDCPTGPADIIHNNSDGYLVVQEDVNAMADAINSLLGDELKRLKFGQEAYRNSRRYAGETIYGKWMKLFSNLRGA
jgi:glycosyltransferase involved in cell wall biosynthesis